MPRLDATIKRFALRIALPVVLVLAGTIATVIVSLNQMGGEVDRIELDLSKRSAEAAVHSVLRGMEDSHGDYAQWDDAVRNLYGTADPNFLKETFTSSTSDAIFFDTVFLLDESGKVVYATRNGEPVDVTPEQAFGRSFDRLLADLPLDGKNYAVHSAIVRGGFGLMALAVGPVVPFSASFPNPPKRARILVIARAFDGDAVTRLGQDFVIGGLHLVSTADEVPFSVELRDPSGAVVGVLTWADPKLGNRAHASVGAVVVVMLVLLTGTMAFLLFVAVRSLREVRRGELDAIRAATHDKLTDLPNRAAMIVAIGEALARRPRSGTMIGVAYLDLDGFKDVNDAYGHEAGDQLLKLVAENFRVECGEHMLARIGGDEFAVLIARGNPTRTAPALGRDLVRSLSQPFNIDGRIVAVGTSVGIAVAEASEISAEELLRRADVAMYEAKQQGPNRIYVYHASIDTIRHERLEVAGDLRAAIADDKLEMIYQPIFAADGGDVVGVEALVSWQRQGAGPVSPNVFIPIAEETGVIDELGAWALKRACTDAASWPNLRLSVNVSPAQLRNPNFDQFVAETLAATGFAARRLEIEMTERHFALRADQVRTSLDGLRALGASVALDDFGAGYSSIGYLREFTFSRIKLDRSLVQGVATDQRAERLAVATISLAQALGLAVTGEGVETEQQAAALRKAGCTELQGFLLARPCTASEMAALLARQDGKPVTHLRALSA